MDKFQGMYLEVHFQERLALMNLQVDLQAICLKVSSLNKEPIVYLVHSL